MSKGFTVLNQDWQQRVYDIFAAQGFMELLCIRLTEVSPGAVEMRVPHHQKLTQHGGYFHGGLMGTLVDNSCGCAAATLMPADMNVLTVEYKINMLRPGLGDELVVRAEVIKPGKQLTVCRCDVFARRDGEEILCATGQATLISLPVTPE